MQASLTFSFKMDLWYSFHSQWLNGLGLDSTLATCMVYTLLVVFITMLPPVVNDFLQSVAVVLSSLLCYFLVESLLNNCIVVIAYINILTKYANRIIRSTKGNRNPTRSSCSLYLLGRLDLAYLKLMIPSHTVVVDMLQLTESWLCDEKAFPPQSMSLKGMLALRFT